MKKPQSLLFAILFVDLAVLLTGMGCGGGGTQKLPPPQLVSISVTPANQTLTLGVNERFSAIGQYTDSSTRDLTASVQWSSGDTNILWLNNSSGRKGTGTPRATGSTTVQATLDAITGTTGISVAALAPRFGYVANQDDGTLSRFVLDTTLGEMRAKEYLYLGATNPYAAVSDPASHFLFLLDASSDSLWSYTIDASSGLLSPIAASMKVASGARSLAIAPQGNFLYVGSQKAGNVSAYSIDVGTGALAAVTGSPFSAGAGTIGLALDPTGRFLYAANLLENTVSAFLVGAAGNLTAVTASPFRTGQGPTSLAVDMTGQYLYTADSNGNTVSGFAIDSTTGALTALSGSPYSAGDIPISLAFEPGGKYMYVANQGDAGNAFTGSISAFTLNPEDGSLTALSTTAGTGTEPRSIVADPSGNIVYLVNHGSHDLWSFNINRQSGALSLLQITRSRTGPASMAFAAGKNPVVLTPTYAYAVGPGASGVGAYSVDASTEALTEIGGSPFGTAGASISAAIHPSGKFLYVGNYWSYKLSAYAVDSKSGALTAAPGSPYSFPSVNSGPFLVVPEPSGRFLYMTNGYDVLAGMGVDPATGALTTLGWGPIKMGDSGPWGPHGLAIDPAGRFLYVVNSAMMSISGFQINPADGSLTELSGSPLSLNLPGNYLESVSIDPSGKYLYVPVRCASWSQNCTDHPLLGFGIDARDGHLTPLQGSPWEVPVPDLLSIAIDAHGHFLYVEDGGQGLAATTGTYGFAIDPRIGALGNIAGSPFPPPGYAFLNPDPIGKVLYGGHDTGIRVYKIDQSTGVLSISQDVPFSAGGPLWSVTVNSVTK